MRKISTILMNGLLLFIPIINGYTQLHSATKVYYPLINDYLASEPDKIHLKS